MFDVIKEEFIDLKKLNLVYLYHSLNQPQISPGAGLSAQQAEAYLMIFQTAARQLVMYVGLFFAQSNKRVLYKVGPFNPENLETQMSESEVFTSQMGFLMTNLHFNSATADEKQEFIRTNPFFYADIDLYYQSLSISEIEVKRSQGESTARKEAEADIHQLFFQQYVTILSLL